MESPSSEGFVGDLDLSIMKQVGVAIKALADTQKDKDEIESTSPSLQQSSKSDRLTLAQLEAQCVECREKISSLEEEIHLLDDEVNKKESPLEHVTDEQLEKALFSLSDFQHSPSDGTHTQPLNSTDPNIKLLKSKIALNSSLTGIKFKSIDWEITRTDEEGLFRKYDHVGTAHGFEFHVQFIAREEKDTDSGSNEAVCARIVGLRMKVDPRLERGLLPFLSQCTTECDLMRFYQIYGKYCLCVKQRRKAFKEATELYGKCVKISEDHLGNRLHLSIEDGPSLNMVWNVGLSGDGSVEQSLALQVKTSPNVCDEEREELGRLPQLLQGMVELHGCKEALFKTLKHLNPS